MKKTIGDFKGKIFCLFLSLSLLVLFPANSWADAGIIDNSDYNDKSFFRAFKIEGSFTDNIGNYGNWNAFVTTYITDGKVTKLDFSNQFKFQNKKKFYMQGFRQEGTDEGAGVGKAMIVYPDKSFKSLINSKCVYSVKYLEDTFFGQIKCDIPKEGLREIEKISE